MAMTKLLLRLFLAFVLCFLSMRAQGETIEPRRIESVSKLESFSARSSALVSPSVVPKPSPVKATYWCACEKRKVPNRSHCDCEGSKPSSRPSLRPIVKPSKPTSKPAFKPRRRRHRRRRRYYWVRPRFKLWCHCRKKYVYRPWHCYPCPKPSPSPSPLPRIDGLLGGPSLPIQQFWTCSCNGKEVKAKTRDECYAKGQGCSVIDPAGASPVTTWWCPCLRKRVRNRKTCCRCPKRKCKCWHWWWRNWRYRRHRSFWRCRSVCRRRC